MLRTDYISLNDREKLELLSKYYVDYFGQLPAVLAESDLLIVGRRGTGKTTLLYRAMVEAMRSWRTKTNSVAKPRTLGIYVDLSKCQSLEADSDFEHFEHAVVTEICDAIAEQMMRFWPELAGDPGWFSRLFQAAETRRVGEVKEILSRIATILREGVPRIVDRSGVVAVKQIDAVSTTDVRGVGGSLSSAAGGAKLDVNASEQAVESSSIERGSSTQTTYRLLVSDIFRLLADLRDKADLSGIHIFIDEYSALSDELQRRFSTLLRKMLGSHAGVFVKISAITDKYVLGTSIILQRDLFELSLDLDAYVERSGTLNDAMEGLRDQARAIVTSRLEAYGCPPPEDLFDAPDDAWTSLSRAAMGVPRTLGIVLQKAWSRGAQWKPPQIRKTDISYGINYASKAYLNQLVGAAREGIAIPEVHLEVWNALLGRAQGERSKVPDVPASHFQVLVKHEEMLRLLNMFFLVHLVSKGRTTKKEKSARSLYCFDYGICEEYNLGYTTHKDVIRQQRFAYDQVLIAFEPEFRISGDPVYSCPSCGTEYRESDLMVAGSRLTFCPKDKTDLVREEGLPEVASYTEEEVKIIGAIRSASRGDQLYARQIADDVGCYVQKVAKFGEKLDRSGVIDRDRAESEGNWFTSPLIKILHRPELTAAQTRRVIDANPQLPALPLRFLRGGWFVHKVMVP